MKKIIMLCVSLVLLGLFLLGQEIIQKTQVMEVSVISPEDAQSLLAARTPFSEEDMVSLQINGIEAAWEQEEKRYYIPKNMEEDYWKGTLSATAKGLSVSVAWLFDDAFFDMRQAIADEHMFQ